MKYQKISTKIWFVLLIQILLFSSLVYAQDPFVISSFNPDTVMASRGVAWADYDNDGYPDFYVTNGTLGFKQQNFLYHNNGDGTFTKITSGPPAEDLYVSNGCTWGDFDNDGDLDLYVATTVGSYDDPVINNCLYENNGDGTFTKNTTAGPAVDDREYSCAAGWGDYNNDGFVDLFIKNGLYPKQPNSLYLNNGNKTFADITNIPLVSNENATLVSKFAWGDYDNDGDLDIAIAVSDGLNSAIWRNDGNNVFTKLLNGSGGSILEGGFSSSACWGDYDNDGDLDLFIANYGKSAPQPNFLYRNDGNDVFTRIVDGPIVNDEIASLGCAWGDIDNDGDLDMFVGNDLGTKNILYLNNGDGTFTRDTTSVVSDYSFTYGSAFADYNKDGFIDLFVCREAKNILFENNGPNNGNSNHWIDIQCVGTSSNKAGIGARLRIKANVNSQPLWQMREICAQNGYGGHDDLRAHFGLADATVIDELSVEWPSGIVQTLTNVAVDQFLTITESNSTEMIKITAPNGGESLQPGSVYDVIWSSNNTSGQLTIEYSTDGGGLWNEIISNEPDDGSYPWTVPNNPSSNCLIRITDSDGNPFDVSDNVFTIEPATYILTMAVDPTGTGTTDPPEGDHAYTDGTVITIIATPLTGYIFNNWTGEVADPNNDTTTVTMNANKLVTAHFAQQNYTLTMVVNPEEGGTTEPAPGDHDYTDGQVVTIIAEPANGYQFANWTGDVTDPNNDTTTVTMNIDKTVTANFQASSSFITITAPNGGEDWEVGSVQNITWTSETTSGTVRLEYSSDNGSNWTEIMASTEDDGAHSWTVPDDPSTNCLVRVTDTDGDPTDLSDAVFTISQSPFITVTAPNGGEDWEVGSSHNITWNSNKTSGTVSLEYSTDNGSNWTEIIASTEDDGTHSWTVPDDPSTNCLVRVTDTDGDPADISDAVFTISQSPFITLTAPNGGEDWEVGSSQNITWNANKTSGTVKLEYSTDNGSNWTEIIASTEDDGTHSWTVPDDPSTNCLVRVSDTDSDPTDVSDAVFTISQSPFITVTAPNGGEDWEVGSVHNITWNSNKTSGTVKLEYSTDNGSNWTEIIASTEDNGIFEWTVPDNPSSNCLVKITDTDGTPFDQSDEVFIVSQISYTLTMAVNPVNGGTTDPTTGDHSYPQETVVNISATPATGYQFVNWTGDVADPNNDTTTVTMSTNKTVTANFSLIPIIASQASIVGENILLEWSPSLVTTIYNVYRDSLFNFEPDTINGTNRIGYQISDEDPDKDGIQWTDTGNGADIVGDVNKNYFYKVTAVADVESAPSNVLGEFDYNLITTSSTDINVIAVIMNTKNSSTPILTAEDLVNSIPNCSDVYYWNAEGQGTVGHPKGVPFNNFNIYPGYPYIVNVTQNTVWTVAGTYSDTSFQLITTDATDINHIAVPLTKNTLTTAEELGQDIPNCSDVYYWNAEGQGTTGHVMGLPFNDFVVRAGYPYYVNVTSATVWPASGGSLLKTNSSSSNNKVVTGGSIPHTVYGELSFTDGVQAKIDQLQIKAWMAGRPSEVLTNENTGVGCDENYWWVGVGNFVTKWTVGESLHVEITAAEHGLRGTTMVLLCDAGSDKGSTINLSRTKNDLGYPLNDPPEEFALLPNYPNPFNPETCITYHLPIASQVILKIYNLLGAEVSTLVNENKEAGIHRIVWNGKDARGREVPSGIYLVKIQAGDFNMNRKMVKVE